MKVITTPRSAKTRQRNREIGQGFLAEIGIGKLVGGIGLIGAIAVGVVVLNTANSQNGEALVEAIITKVQDKYGTQGIYTGLTSEVIATSGALPSNVAPSGSNQIITPWHSLITLASTDNSITGLTDGAWTMDIPNTPTAQCNDLSVQHYSGEIAISVGGSAQSGGSSGAGSTQNTNFAPPSPDQVATACSGSSNGAAEILLTLE